LLVKKFCPGSVGGFVNRGLTNNATAMIATTLPTIHFVLRFIVTSGKMIFYITRLRNKKGSREGLEYVDSWIDGFNQKSINPKIHSSKKPPLYRRSG